MAFSSKTFSSSKPGEDVASAWRCFAIWRASHCNASACRCDGMCSTGTRPPSTSTAASAPRRCKAGSRNNSAAMPWPHLPREQRMADQSFDIVILGGGPGGYVAAIRAAQLGMKTAVVEREQLGGICLNWGCIPTKALLKSSEIYHLLQRLDEFGFSAKDIRFDAGKVVARSRAVAKRLSDGVAYLLRKNKVTVVDGHGRLAGKGRLAVE